MAITTVLIIEDDPTMLRGLKDNFASHRLPTWSHGCRRPGGTRRGARAARPI